MARSGTSNVSQNPPFEDSDVVLHERTLLKTRGTSQVMIDRRDNWGKDEDACSQYCVPPKSNANFASDAHSSEQVIRQKLTGSCTVDAPRDLLNSVGALGSAYVVKSVRNPRQTRVVLLCLFEGAEMQRLHHA
jgi:hypothetical protein